MVSNRLWWRPIAVARHSLKAAALPVASRLTGTGPAEPSERYPFSRSDRPRAHCARALDDSYNSASAFVSGAPKTSPERRALRPEV
jgi:hypothetical protein